MTVLFLSYLLTKVKLTVFGQTKPDEIRPVGNLIKNSKQWKVVKRQLSLTIYQYFLLNSVL